MDLCVGVVGNPGGIFQKGLDFSCSRRLGRAVSSDAWVVLAVIAVSQR